MYNSRLVRCTTLSSRRLRGILPLGIDYHGCTNLLLPILGDDSDASIHKAVSPQYLHDVAFVVVGKYQVHIKFQYHQCNLWINVWHNTWLGQFSEIFHVNFLSAIFRICAKRRGEISLRRKGSSTQMIHWLQAPMYQNTCLALSQSILGLFPWLFLHWILLAKANTMSIIFGVSGMWGQQRGGHKCHLVQVEC